MYNLKRFEDAQEGNPGYEIALQEMCNGRKESRWMCFVFPQVKGLGDDYESKYYGIDSLYEACQYLEYGKLGSRLREITREVLRHYENGIYHIMGNDDDTEIFRSCMTLFDVVCPGECFKEALDTFFDGERDGRTLSIIRTEREYLHTGSAFQRYNIGFYQDKGFFESGSEESNEIPRKQVFPTIVDLFLKGESIKNMLHHYLYHRDFSPYRLDGVESTLEHYCHVLLFDVYSRANRQQQVTIGKQLMGWDARINDVESAAETLDWMLGIMQDNAESLLVDYAKESLIVDKTRMQYC